MSLLIYGTEAMRPVQGLRKSFGCLRSDYESQMELRRDGALARVMPNRARAQQPGSCATSANKPTPGGPEVGAQIISFNFPNSQTRAIGQAAVQTGCVPGRGRSLPAKLEGEFATGSDTYTGTMRVKYSWQRVAGLSAAKLDLVGA